MSEIVGRAGFHVTHTKSFGERGAILHEMMRELDEDSIAYWAARNPNIVAADERYDEAWVNDGNGGFRRCTDRQEVLDYGDARVGKVRRKLTEDHLDHKTGTMRGGTVTLSLLVLHLPKSMCVEIPDGYPRLSGDGTPLLDAAGKPLWRSRWVARNRDAARRYFEDEIRYLAENVIPGGWAAIHGYDVQHSESTPHVQLLADTFAPDPKHPGSLRAEASRTWFEHRDVRDETGRMKRGPDKMRDYHAGLKAHLVGLGYDISPDFDEVRHMVGHAKADYAKVKDQATENAEREDILDEWADDLGTEKQRLDGVRLGLAAEDDRLRRERELQEALDADLAAREAAVTARERRVVGDAQRAADALQEARTAYHGGLSRVATLEAETRTLRDELRAGTRVLEPGVDRDAYLARVNTAQRRKNTSTHALNAWPEPPTDTDGPELE
ncbi:hypothetical protein [Raineyella sp.]|uniref:Uncharacterized protein n=1 Tax=bioreactor metagenome TaxID=1076179 RepID=A0A644X532_9ZZZZ|nr:hypothetical protein [Raineyella sp.]MEA5155757.1 hypothetical protein [Raineyella sp.]